MQVKSIGKDVGIVAIGRNEGDRLRLCLSAVMAQIANPPSAQPAQQTPFQEPGPASHNTPIATQTVYVDSGSTDGSVQLAKSMGVHVVELDPAIPFTAARARNTGFKYLLARYPNLKYIQFIDGDCELVARWIQEAYECLEEDAQLAVVCGHRQESFPESSVYNRYTNLEWYRPAGENVQACGGDALIRVEALRSVDGYNSAMICGEEPEMCLRMRRLNWKIQRLDRVMVFHDAAMTEFRQWWRRAVRGGWAVSEGYAMYGRAPEKYMVHRYLSGWGWGAILPLLAVLLAVHTHGLSLLLLLLYPVLMLRIFRFCRQSYRYSPADALVYAFFCTLSKFAQAVGQLQYWLTRWKRETPLLIEYKKPAALK
ncbi:MAG: glycosyltransferase [Cyanobacteria bacterium J06623_4]